MKRVFVIPALLILIATTSLPIARVSASNKNDEERPIRLYANAGLGPIGAIESAAPVLINGRARQTQHVLWGGEVIQAQGSNVLISFENMGQVVLSRGSQARFSAGFAAADEGEQRVLIGSVITGDVRLKLKPEAGAFIQARGTEYTAAPGASFAVGIREGRAVLDTTEGAVSVSTQTPQRNYILRPIGSGSTVSVRARATRQLQIQVTDENDRRVPDLPIIFLLGSAGPNAGSLTAGLVSGASVTATTNAQGIATVTFQAGPNAGSQSVTATVQGTDISHTWSVDVIQSVGFWSTRNTLLTVAAVAAGGAAVVTLTQPNNTTEPLRPIPPPEVNP